MLIQMSHLNKRTQVNARSIKNTLDDNSNNDELMPKKKKRRRRMTTDNLYKKR